MSKYISNNVGRDFRLPMLAFETWHEQVLTPNKLQKSIFQPDMLCYHY